MFEDTTIYLVGATFGFLTFLVGTIMTEGIFYRPDVKGRPVFTLTIFKDYLVGPFEINTSNFNTLWTVTIDMSLIDRFRVLQMNWLCMVMIGLIVSKIIIMLKYYFF
jgi:hypothetical protein